MHIETMFDQISNEIEKQEDEMCMGVHPDYLDTRPLFTPYSESSKNKEEENPIYEEDFTGEEDPDFVDEDDDEEKDWERDWDDEDDFDYNEDEEDEFDQNDPESFPEDGDPFGMIF